MGNMYIIITAIVLFGGWTTGVFYYGDYHGYDRCHVSMANKIAEETDKARKEEQKKQEAVDEIHQTQANNLAAINNRLNDELNKLRSRSSSRHMPENPQAECKGATGRELSKPDAEFLTRLAARADGLREALKSCYAYADTVSAISK